MIKIKRKSNWVGSYRLEYDGRYIYLYGKDKDLPEYPFNRKRISLSDLEYTEVVLCLVAEQRNASPEIIRTDHEFIYIDLHVNRFLGFKNPTVDLRTKRNVFELAKRVAGSNSLTWKEKYIMLFQGSISQKISVNHDIKYGVLQGSILTDGDIIQAQESILKEDVEAMIDSFEKYMINESKDDLPFTVLT